MTKGRSKRPLFSRDDLSLPRAKILRGRKNFKRLFERNAYIHRQRLVSLRYQIVDASSFDLLMGFIVKKSLGKANERNHMKRLLKEAYRLNQHMLAAPLQEAKITFHGALMANSVGATFAEVEKDVVTLLNEVKNQLPSISSGNS